MGATGRIPDSAGRTAPAASSDRVVVPLPVACRRTGRVPGALVLVLAVVLAVGAGVATSLLLRHAPEERPPEVPVVEAHPAPVGPRVPAGGFPAAEAVADGSWNRKNNEGVDLLEAGELDEAIALFQACVDALPDNETFRGNLAEALARRASALRKSSRHDPAALDELARAVEIDPGREDLAALLARWREEADVEQDFWRADGYAFELVYDAQRIEIDYHAPILLGRLELAYDDLRLAFGVDPVADGGYRIRVGLYTRDEFERLTGLGHWAGGVYDGTVRVPVDDLADESPHLDRVLRHELSHHFSRQAGGRDVPGWLDEGLAQWNEGRDPARVEDARALLRDGGTVPLDRLRGTLASLGDEDTIRRAYAEALALVDFVAGSAWGGEHLLYELVRGCSEGHTVEETFEQQAGFPLEEAFRFFVEDL